MPQLQVNQSKLQKTISLIALLLFVSACGLKGDLYMPEPEPQVVDSTETQSSNQDDVPEKIEESTPIPE